MTLATGTPKPPCRQQQPIRAVALHAQSEHHPQPGPATPPSILPGARLCTVTGIPSASITNGAPPELPHFLCNGAAPASLSSPSPPAPTSATAPVCPRHPALTQPHIASSDTSPDFEALGFTFQRPATGTTELSYDVQASTYLQSWTLPVELLSTTPLSPVRRTSLSYA
jgi:hypothetical protein